MNPSHPRRTANRLYPASARYKNSAAIQTRVPHAIVNRIDAMPGNSKYAKVRELIVLGLQAYEAKTQMPKQ